MSPGSEALTRAVIDRTVYRPDLFRATVPDVRQRLLALVADTPGIQVYDEIGAQLRELVRTRHPGRSFTPEALEQAVAAHLAGTPVDDYGVWAYYPWSRRLVHLLDEAEFSELRTDRNRNKITRQEQQRLAQARIGVIGLSVGQSVCLTLAQERSFGELRIADHDQLDLSNLNRLRTGVHDLGVNKAVIVAREIAEIDPFLKVTLFPEGITKNDLDRFFTEGGKLDIVVDECDSVDIKILCRQKARELGVAVVMDTSDRGLVDVERYDREPGRALLHGLIDHLDPEAAAKARTNEEKLPFLIPMAGLATLSPRMKASMMELGDTLLTWPQLASAVTLGGALAGDICRRILLDQLTTSGRWWVDMEELISDPVHVDEAAAPVAPAPPTLEQMLRTAALLAPTSGEALTPSEAERIVEAGALAPSAGNMQPWAFLLHEGRIFLFHDRSRSTSALDPEELIAHLGLGACAENMVLRAGALGVDLGCALFPLAGHPELIAVLQANGRSATRDPLEPLIPIRHTNRKKGDASPLAPDVQQALQKAVADVAGAELTVVQERSAIDALAAICGEAERIRALNPHGQREFFSHEMRWDPTDAARTGDGLDIDTLELALSERTGLRIAGDPRAMALLRAWSGGSGLKDLARTAVSSSSAVAVVSMPTTALADRLRAGRAAQRVWLAAAGLGLAAHPVSAPLFLAHHLRFGSGSGLSEAERTAVYGLHERTEALLGRTGREPLFLLRLSIADAASARSLRRPLRDMLHIPTHQTA